MTVTARRETVVRAQLFVTCMVDLFRPRAGVAAVQVLERRGVEVEFPGGQSCCGQFAYNAGHHRVAELSEWLDRQAVPEPEGVGTRAESGGPASSGGPGYAGASGSSTPLKVASHTGCHMRRLLGATEAPLSVLRRAGVEPVELDDAEQCCGFGGSFGLLEPDISAAMADAKLANLATARGDGVTCLVSADLGCLMQLGGRLDRQGDAFPMLHLAEAVDLADRHRLTPADIERTARSQEADPDAR